MVRSHVSNFDTDGCQMPSNAYRNFQQRLNEIQQLVDAHGALVRLKRAEVAHADAAGDMSQIGRVVEALVSAPA